MSAAPRVTNHLRPNGGASAPRLAPLEREETSGKVRELLDGVAQRGGEPGPMVRTMANARSLLQGYLELSRATKAAKLPKQVSERISLAVQQELGCELCIAAHSHAARSLGLSEEEIILARRGTAAEPALAALLSFALSVLRAPGSIGDDDIARLRALGHGDRDIAEIVGLVALNLMTGAFNLVAGLEPAECEPRLPAGDVRTSELVERR